MANSGIERIEFINDGFKAILSSEGCLQAVTEATQTIADNANANNQRGGTGFNSKVEFGTKAQRYIGFVHTTDKASAIAESEDGALTRGIL